MDFRISAASLMKSKISELVVSISDFTFISTSSGRVCHSGIDSSVVTLGFPPDPVSVPLLLVTPTNRAKMLFIKLKQVCITM